MYLHRDPDATCVTESSLESSPTLFPLRSPVPVPQTSSTPHKDSAQDKDPSGLKWSVEITQVPLAKKGLNHLLCMNFNVKSILKVPKDKSVYI